MPSISAHRKACRTPPGQSARLSKRRTPPILGILGALLFLTAWVWSDSALWAQPSEPGLSPTSLNRLGGSPKLRNPGSILKALQAGEPETRIIVNLRPPAEIQTLTDFKDSRVRQERRTLIRDLQDRVLSALESRPVRITNRFVYVSGFSAAVGADGLQSLVDHPLVASVDPDPVLQPHLHQGIDLINAAGVRGTYTGSGTAIAICDTGIDYEHPKLGGGGFPNSKVIGGYDTGQNDADPMDADGHGTSCAGIAAGDSAAVGDYVGGVAPEAKLYALKITYTEDEGNAYSSDMVEAWEWCITHQHDDPNSPIRIVSTSFGGGRFYDQASCDEYIVAMTQAAANARAAGITLFVSSGNDGFCDSISWPGCLREVIGVGAVYDAAFGTYYPCVSPESCVAKTYSESCPSEYYATDSTRADMVASYSNTAAFLSLLAPANRAHTTDITGAGGYNTSGDYVSGFGGTSAACPYAAGAAALLQEAAQTITGAYLTPNRVKSILTQSGDPVPDDKVAITKPRLNLGAAVDRLGAPAPGLFFPVRTREGKVTIIYLE